MSHIHNIIDTGNRFVINPELRTITTKTSSLILTQGDHNSKRYTFEVPRFVEGHDMQLCNRIEIHYDNISRNEKEFKEGIYIANDINVDGDNVTFSWLISGNVTRLAGTVEFWINFACVNANGELVYSWGTDIFKSIKVITNNRNTDEVISLLPDVLEQWKQEVLDGVEISGDAVYAAVSEYLDKNSISTGSTATIGVVELLADNWISNGNLHYQVVDIDGVTENSQVDLTPSVEQLMVFYEKDLTFVTENDDGVVTVYAIGQKPVNDYVVQVTITEVLA